MLVSQLVSLLSVSKLAFSKLSKHICTVACSNNSFYALINYKCI